MTVILEDGLEYIMIGEALSSGPFSDADDSFFLLNGSTIRTISQKSQTYPWMKAPLVLGIRIHVCHRAFELTVGVQPTIEHCNKEER